MTVAFFTFARKAAKAFEYLNFYLKSKILAVWPERLHKFS